jgi:hypothetical protein
MIPTERFAVATSPYLLVPQLASDGERGHGWLRGDPNGGEGACGNSDRSLQESCRDRRSEETFHESDEWSRIQVADAVEPEAAGLSRRLARLAVALGRNVGGSITGLVSVMPRPTVGRSIRATSRLLSVVVSVLLLWRKY